MEIESGFSNQILVLVIIIVIAIAGVFINQVVGRNGVIEKVTEVESKYNKEDILEQLNYKVTQNFIELNNIAKENNQSISDLYNSDVVIQFLKENEIIVEALDDDGNFIDGIYNINVKKLKDEQVDNTVVNGEFRLEKKESKYFVIYYDEVGNVEEIGELQIQQMM